jgi:hypothetical protein
MHFVRTILAFFSLFGLAIGFAMAEAPARSGFGPHPGNLGELLNIDGDRAANVEAILMQAREKIRSAVEQVGPPNDEATRATLRAAMEAIRSDTDGKLAALLTPDELARLRSKLPSPVPRLQPGSAPAGSGSNLIFRKG